MIERTVTPPRVHVLVVALIALGWALAFAPAAAAQDEPRRFSMKVVGSGPDVIMIPGLSMPRETWERATKALEGRYRLHLLQVRGFGEPAGANAEGPILQPLVDELAAYIEANDLESPAVVGHSMGGLTALMLAVQYPDLPGELLIVDALPWAGVMVGGGGEATTQTLEPRFATMRDALVATASQPMPEEAIRAETAGIAGEENRALVADWMRRADRRVTGQAFYDDMMADLREEIGRITAPVTVLYPWREGYPGRKATEVFYRSQYRALPAAELIGIANAGHFIMLDQPGAFQAALDRFLMR